MRHNAEKILRHRNLAIVIGLFTLCQSSQGAENRFWNGCQALLRLVGISRQSLSTSPEHTGHSPEPLPVFQREPLICRQRFVSAENVSEAHRIIAREATPDAQAEAAFNFYLEVRLRGYPSSFARKVRRIIAERKDSVDPSNPSVGGYHIGRPALFSRMSMGLFVNPVMNRMATYYSTLAHETEHLIQRLDREYRSQVGGSTDWDQYFREFGAVRAEFEYWSLIPESLRERDIQLAGQLPDVPLGRNHTLNEIRASNQGFDEFRRNHLYRSFEATRDYYRNGVIPSP